MNMITLKRIGENGSVGSFKRPYFSKEERAFNAEFLDALLDRLFTPEQDKLEYLGELGALIYGRMSMSEAHVLPRESKFCFSQTRAVLLL